MGSRTPKSFEILKIFVYGADFNRLNTVANTKSLMASDRKSLYAERLNDACQQKNTTISCRLPEWQKWMILGKWKQRQALSPYGRDSLLSDSIVFAQQYK